MSPVLGPLMHARAHANARSRLHCVDTAPFRICTVDKPLSRRWRPRPNIASIEIQAMRKTPDAKSNGELTVRFLAKYVFTNSFPGAITHHW